MRCGWSFAHDVAASTGRIAFDPSGWSRFAYGKGVRRPLLAGINTETTLGNLHTRPEGPSLTLALFRPIAATLGVWRFALLPGEGIVGRPVVFGCQLGATAEVAAVKPVD
jgi:hypothetical protein